MIVELTRVGFDSAGIRRSSFQDIGNDVFSFEGTYPSKANEYDRSLLKRRLSKSPQENQ